MANEVQGLLFETIVDEALRRAVQHAKVPGVVRWNEQPVGMTVAPDFTVGVDPDRPSHVILVTTSGAEQNSELKAWRNLGEMQEVKAQLPNTPLVINISLVELQKEGLGKVARRLYDASLEVGNKSYGRVLLSWVANNLRNAAKSKQAKRELLAHDVNGDKLLSEAVDAFSKDLAEALGKQNTQLQPLWQLMHQDYLVAGKPLVARKTAVRRGLAKLYVLPHEIRALVYKNAKKLIRNGLPDYAFQLGFFSDAIGGARLADADIQNALALLGADKCEQVLQGVPQTMEMWAEPLRTLDKVQAYVRFVRDQYHRVTDPVQLKQLLVSCYEDPVGLLPEAGRQKVWLFETMVSLLKAKSGKRQGYGLSKLAKDTGLGMVRFIIPAFVQREALPDDAELDALANGFARRFASELSVEDIERLVPEVVESVKQENLEDRLIPYRNFEPLLWLLYDALDQAGLQYSPRAPVAGWAGEYGEAEGTVSTTPFVAVGGTLIHWKTVSDAGKVHKKKELAARVRSVKYQYDPTSGQFTRRRGVKELVLIVDGTFDTEDLDVLVKAGWDTIVYPDEIPDLAKRLR